MKIVGCDLRAKQQSIAMVDPAIGLKTINAMSETVAERSAFRDALRRRRCLIPANGFL